MLDGGLGRPGFRRGLAHALVEQNLLCPTTHRKSLQGSILSKIAHDCSKSRLFIQSDYTRMTGCAHRLMSYSCMVNKSARESEDGERLSNWENEGGALGSHPKLGRRNDNGKDLVTASLESKKSVMARSGSSDGRSTTPVSSRELPIGPRS